MYVAINNAESTNLSKTKTAQNTIQIYKITTPFRMNAPFIYRVDITTFLPYLTNAKIKTKLSNYKTSTSTTSIDLPTALLISYYDKNPQSPTNRNTVLSPQELLTSYYKNQPILSDNQIPTIKPSVSGSVPSGQVSNRIERFNNTIGQLINDNNYSHNKINNQYVKYALF